MLLVDKKQYTPQQIEKVLGITIPLDKILKKPLFEINPANLVNDSRNNGPGAVRVRQGMEFPAVFRVKLSDGNTVEIRYCTNRTPDVKTHGQTEIYTPKKVPFEGKAEFLNDEQDKAVFYYLHFYNRQSPFRGEGFQYEGKPYEYEFQDDIAKANIAIAAIELRSKATYHASQLQGEELLIVAKGMRIDGANELEPEMVRARLMQFADAQPQKYLDMSASTVNHIEGLILDAIDKHILIMDNSAGVKRWRWAVGERKDEVIVELPNSVPNHKEALITHIQQMPGVVNTFIPLLMNARVQLLAKNNITEKAKEVNIMDLLKQESHNAGTSEENEREYSDWADANTTNHDDVIYRLPATREEASELLGSRGASKAPMTIKQLLDGIKDGTINLENIAVFIAANQKKNP